MSDRHLLRKKVFVFKDKEESRKSLEIQSGDMVKAIVFKGKKKRNLDRKSIGPVIWILQHENKIKNSRWNQLEILHKDSKSRQIFLCF